MPNQGQELVEHLFREQYGKLVSILTGMFGSAHIELAEDVVQDTLMAAIDNWATSGVPDNPAAWLMLVAKRKAINALKRQRNLSSAESGNLEDPALDEQEEVFLDTEIEDSQLRMIFTCCHPSLSVESQIALTLKTLCGFGVTEVANALMTTEPTVNKRLYRAKKTIRELNGPFSIPQGNHLDRRLDVVTLTLYLLFNEGYNSSSGNLIIRKELCLEAFRLTNILVSKFSKYKELSALLSLMCFHIARFDARIDDHGALVIFEDQDRSLWNKSFISHGIQYLKSSSGGDKLSAYHLEAGIGAEHCMADSFENTNWSSIHYQYQLLLTLKPNPVIELNLAIIEGQLSGELKALESLNALEASGKLKDYYLLSATKGIFLMKLNRKAAALEYLHRAKAQTRSQAERSFLEQQIGLCQT